MSGSNTNAYPLDTVVYITDYIGGTEWQGSGVLISPDEVLTAAHVVYDSSIGTATDITVTPDYDDGYAPYGSAAGTSFNYEQVQDGGDTITVEQSQFDYAVIHLSHPFNIGTMALAANFGGGAVDVAGYPGSAGGVLVNRAEQVSVDPQYSILDGTSIGSGSSGGPVWVTGSNGMPEVVGLVSSGLDFRNGPGYFVQLTSTAVAAIQAWVTAADGTAAPTSSAPLAVEDTTTNSALAANTQSYSGRVTGLQNEYINITTDNLNITVTTPGWFLHSGSGSDALAVSSGTNVLDGGTGSNFLTGGSGTDTFFVDDRGATSDTWSTVANFHSGDSATIWGVNPTTFNITTVDGQGASGYTGLTLHATQSAAPTASLTLAGFTTAALSNGQISLTYGTDAASGSSYAYLHAT